MSLRRETRLGIATLTLTLMSHERGLKVLHRDEVERTLTAAVIDILDGQVAPETLRDDEPGKARKSDPETSKKAATHQLPRKASQRWKLLRALELAGANGLTADQASRITEVPYRSLTPRVGELKHGGWIAETGETRPTSTGAEAEVLALTEMGLWAWSNRRSLPDPDAEPIETDPLF